MSELKKLSDWARENNIPYKKAWRMHERGELPVKTKETKSGRILVEAKASEQPKELNFATAVWADKATKTLKTALASDPIRGNKTSREPNLTYNMPFIEGGVEPFILSNRKDFWDINWVIFMCQKAYWNFSVFRNIIDAMTDFSISNIYFQGGTEKSRRFFQDLMQKINILGLLDKFFREYYRSGNAFLYRFESIPTNNDLGKLNKTYGSNANTSINESDAAKRVKLPAKYVILNPCDISVQANIAFANAMMFFKRLNGYEIHRLRYAAQNPDKANEEEINFLKSLPKITQDQIKAGAGAIIIPLDPDILYAVFYKRQDYEPLAVPLGWPVLRDIEWKAEMKAIDMAVSRTMNNVILLIKMGFENKQGEYMVDQKAITNMQQLFQSESVGKTLVSDFTTEAQFVIPAIGDFLDPVKYQVVNEDIKQGLNYILTGTGEKFANQHIQVKLFIERLKQARDSFLVYFLKPEIDRIFKAMGFKGRPPQAIFEDIDLKDSDTFDRIITQLAQFGILTPSETVRAIDTGRLPTEEESIESQTKFKPLKDKGYYEPLIGGPATQKQIQQMNNDSQMDLQQNNQEHDEKMTKLQQKHEKENPPPVPPQPIHVNLPGKIGQPTGRPGGTKGIPQSTKKISPRKMKGSDEIPERHSLSKLAKYSVLASELYNDLSKLLIEKYKVKELNEEQKSIVRSIQEVIMTDNEPEKWKESIAIYVENPTYKNPERLKEIEKKALEHQIDYYGASLLLSSEIKEEDNNVD